jgi:hypothetical protein
MQAIYDNIKIPESRGDRDSWIPLSLRSGIKMEAIEIFVGTWQIVR